MKEVVGVGRVGARVGELVVCCGADGNVSDMDAVRQASSSERNREFSSYKLNDASFQQNIRPSPPSFSPNPPKRRPSVSASSSTDYPLPAIASTFPLNIFIKDIN